MHRLPFSNSNKNVKVGLVFYYGGHKRRCKGYLFDLVVQWASFPRAEKKTTPKPPVVWVKAGADEQELATPILSLCHGIF